MGLISRVSSRTYRKKRNFFKENGPESYLQAPFAQKAKQEVRAKPDRSVQENRQQQLATTKGHRQCLSTTIQWSSLPPRYRLRYQQRSPTCLPRPDGFQEISRSQLGRTQLLDDVQPSLGLRNRLRCQLQKANLHH